MEKFFPANKIILSGNPVREELLNSAASSEEAYSYFGLRAGSRVILILGGSLGARTINFSVLKHIELIEKEDIQVIWQTGKLYRDMIREKLGDREFKNIRYMDFINRMDLAYTAADVIVSRAGAGTISELCCIGKPVIWCLHQTWLRIIRQKTPWPWCKRMQHYWCATMKLSKPWFPKPFSLPKMTG